VKQLIKMAKTGLAKGINSGHVTTEIERVPKASRTKGVSEWIGLDSWRYCGVVGIAVLLPLEFVPVVHVCT
jgi:hypothetical protein